VGDLNGDGKFDLMVRGFTTFNVLTGSGYFGNYYTPVTDGYVNVLLGTGDGSFNPTAAYHLDHNVGPYGTGDNVAFFGVPSNLALGDFNGDGKLDVVALGNDMNVLLGNGNGTLQAPLHSAVYGASVVAGDLNGDGKLDLVIDPNGVQVLKGNGDGTFQAPQTIPVGSYVRSVVLGDVNGDGKLDITLMGSDGGRRAGACPFPLTV
jgi:uncharacterized protein (DUF2141 family)